VDIALVDLTRTCRRHRPSEFRPKRSTGQKTGHRKLRQGKMWEGSDSRRNITLTNGAAARPRGWSRSAVRGLPKQVTLWCWEPLRSYGSPDTMASAKTSSPCAECREVWPASRGGPDLGRLRHLPSISELGLHSSKLRLR